MKRPTTASRRPLERGEFSWVSLLLLVGCVSAVYLGYVWVPVYMVHLEVKQTVRDFMNQAVHNRDDDQLVRRLCNKLAAIENRAQPGQGEEGEEGEAAPTVDVAPADVTWERDTSVSPPQLRVALEYVRTVEYPLLDRTVEVTLGVDFSQDIGVPKWNK